MQQTLAMVLAACCIYGCGVPELPEKYGKTDGRLYVGDGSNQPLLVGLGGSEGGNAWDSDHWKATRDMFLAEGYAFLALEYFGGQQTPDQLDRISLEGVHEGILEAARNPKINAKRICLIGGSKGAELALLLASKYADINCVVAIVPGSAVFPALTLSSKTSAWTFDGKQVPFVPMTWSAVPAALTRDLRKAFTIMLKDTVAVTRALIEVEAIHGPVLLISATKDEMWPSTEMSEQIMATLASNHFAYTYEHIAIEGNHTEPQNHFDKVLEFLKRNFPATEKYDPGR
jgi:dienelactone hydrolase